MVFVETIARSSARGQSIESLRCSESKIWHRWRQNRHLPNAKAHAAAASGKQFRLQGLSSPAHSEEKSNQPHNIATKLSPQDWDLITMIFPHWNQMTPCLGYVRGLAFPTNQKSSKYKSMARYVPKQLEKQGMKGLFSESVTKLHCYERSIDSISINLLFSRSEGRMRDVSKGIRLAVWEKGKDIMLRWLPGCTSGLTEILPISPTCSVIDYTLREHTQWHTPLHGVCSSRRIRQGFSAILTPLVPGYWVCQPEKVWSRMRYYGYWVRKVALTKGRKRLLSLNRCLALRMSLNVTVGQISDSFALPMRVTGKHVPRFVEGNWGIALCFFLPQSQQKVLKIWKSFHKEIPTTIRFCNGFGN